MNYETALKLRDAGFPQEPEWYPNDDVCWGGSWYGLVKPEACVMPVFADPDEYKSGIERGDNLVKFPTLEELIEACGDGFFSLSRHDDIWQTNWIDGMAGDTAGSTPIEAVANLWFKLNKL